MTHVKFPQVLQTLNGDWLTYKLIYGYCVMRDLSNP